MLAAEAGQKTVEGTEGDGQKPEDQEAVAEPSLNGALGGGLQRLPGEEQVGGAIDPRETAEAGYQIPESRLGARPGLDARAAIEEADHPDADHEEREEEHRRGPVRILKPLHPGGVSGEDGERAEQNGEVPENDCRIDQRAQEHSAERAVAEAGHEPDTRGDRRLGGPSIEEEIAGHRLEAAVAQESNPAKEAGGNQLHRGQKGEEGRDDQPVQGVAKKKKHRRTHGGVDADRLGAVGLRIVMVGKGRVAHCWVWEEAPLVLRAFNSGTTSSIARVTGMWMIPLALSLHP